MYIYMAIEKPLITETVSTVANSSIHIVFYLFVVA